MDNIIYSILQQFIFLFDGVSTRKGKRKEKRKKKILS